MKKILTALACAILLPFAAAQEVPTHQPKSTPVKDRYIIVFKDTVGNGRALVTELMRGRLGEVHFIYDGAIKGFAVTLPTSSLQGLRNNPNILYIEQDQQVQLQATQSSATWGLDRIDQPALPLSGSYTYNNTGAGVTAFILDSGIRADHAQFTGRLIPGYTAISDGNGTGDCNGHGTHVAGTVGGTTHGVAKGVTLAAVRVLACDGYGLYSGMIAGLDWVAKHPNRPAVANMSIGGSYSAAMNDAVNGTVAKGVTVVVAAGNDNVDACTKTPASAASAITVGATTSSDSRASFSNWGTCVDIFAPGDRITSATYSGSTSTGLMSGTSMASPHVAGAVALLLGANKTWTPAQVEAALRTGATINRISSAGTGSVNRLLYSIPSTIPSGTEPAPAPAPAPTTSVMYVSSLTGSTRFITYSYWRASVTVTVRASNGVVVPGATASGSFASGSSVSCVTGTAGTCVLTSQNISRYTSTVTFRMLNVTAPSLTYDASKNVISGGTLSRP